MPPTSSKPHRSSRRFRFKPPHQTPRPLTKPRHPSPSTSPRASPAAAGLPSDPSPDPDAEAEPTFTSALFESLSNTAAAEFWADIYGQPIHIYPRPNLAGRALTDDEYVVYVQQRLWENTREGREERARERVKEREQEAARKEREERLAARRRREVAAAEDARREEEDEVFWKESVEMYMAAWEEGAGGDIPWPESSNARGYDGSGSEEEIEQFLRQVARVTGVGFAQVVRAERVRWHPDKILQRFGSGFDTAVSEGADVEGRGKLEKEEMMRRVNAVWRAVDAIWRQVRD